MARNWVPVILGWRFLKLVSLVSLALGRFGNMVGYKGDNEGGSRGGKEDVYGAGLSESGDGACRRDGTCVVMGKGIEMAVGVWEELVHAVDEEVVADSRRGSGKVQYKFQYKLREDQYSNKF